MMEFVNGKDDIPYMKWKIKFMFETTNQLLIYIYKNIILREPTKNRFSSESLLLFDTLQ